MYYLLLMLFFLSSQIMSIENLHEKRQNKEVQVILDKGKVVLLIYSYECGYCATNTQRYNALKDSILNKQPEVKFYVMLETPLRDVIKRHPFLKNVKDTLNWNVINSPNGVYKEYSTENVFPEMYFFEEGKEIKQIIGGIYENEISSLSKTFN